MAPKLGGTASPWTWWQDPGVGEEKVGRRVGSKNFYFFYKINMV